MKQNKEAAPFNIFKWIEGIEKKRKEMDYNYYLESVGKRHESKEIINNHYV